MLDLLSDLVAAKAAAAPVKQMPLSSQTDLMVRRNPLVLAFHVLLHQGGLEVVAVGRAGLADDEGLEGVEGREEVAALGVVLGAVGEGGTDEDVGSLLLERQGSEYLRGLFEEGLLLGVVVNAHDDSISNIYYIPDLDSLNLIKITQKGE
jgi:hypothetical protein